MTQPPGPNEPTNLQEDNRSQIAAELRKEVETEFAKMREDINQGKIYRAEQHAGYMRNWLAILTVTISIVLIVFGFLGYTRTTDIDAYRKQIAADAADVKALSTGVRENVKTVGDSVDSIRTYEQRIAALDSRLKGTDARINNTDKNIADIERRSEQAERQIIGAVTRTSALAQQTHNDLQSSVASGFLGNIPSISTAALVQGPALSFIQGSNFGASPGHIFVDIQYTNFATASLQLPTRIEIQPPFKKWSDTRIDFQLSPSDYQKIKDARASQASASSVSGISSNISVNVFEGLNSPILSLVIETSEGRFSLSGIPSPLSVSWP